MTPISRRQSDHSQSFRGCVPLCGDLCNVYIISHVRGERRGGGVKSSSIAPFALHQPWSTPRLHFVPAAVPKAVPNGAESCAAPEGEVGVMWGRGTRPGHRSSLQVRAVALQLPAACCQVELVWAVLGCSGAQAMAV